MKPKTDLVLNSAAFFIISPMLGIMVAGFIMGFLEGILFMIVGIAGIIVSIFSDFDPASIKFPLISLRVAMWIILVGGSLGGILYAYMEVQEKWQRHKASGKGW